MCLNGSLVWKGLYKKNHVIPKPSDHINNSKSITPTSNCMCKVNNRNTRARCEICSK